MPGQRRQHRDRMVPRSWRGGNQEIIYRALQNDPSALTLLGNRGGQSKSAGSGSGESPWNISPELVQHLLQGINPTVVAAQGGFIYPGLEQQRIAAFAPTISGTSTPTYANTVTIQPGTNQITLQSDTRYVMPSGYMNGGGSLTYAIRNTGWVEHVMIDGVEIANYDPPTQAGVIHLAWNGNTICGRDVIIKDIFIHDCDEVAIKTRIDEIQVLGGVIRDIGRLGLSIGHGANPNAVGGLVDGTTIIRCNANGLYSWGFEAGGSKMWESTNLTVRNVESYGHVGPGLWADKDNLNWIVEDCYIHDIIGAPGIFQEIGSAYTIRRNTIRDCGDRPSAWLWDAGIQVSSSRDGLMYDNTISGCGHGIGLVQQDRGFGSYYEHLLLDSVVYGNIITNSYASGVARADQEYPNIWDRNNDWYGNSYDAGHQFAWKNQWGDLAFWQIDHPNDG